MRDRGWTDPRGARSPPPVLLPRGFPSRCRRTGPAAPAEPWNSSAVASAAASRYRGRARGNLRATPPGLRHRGRAPLPPGTGGNEPRLPRVSVPGWVAVPRRRSPRARAGAGPGLCWRNAAICAQGGRGSRGKGRRAGQRDSGQRGRARCSPPARHRAAPPGKHWSSWLRRAEPGRTKHALVIFNLFFKKSELPVGTGKASDEDPPLFMGKSSVHMYLV